jgi:replicative DNA helicase
VTLKNEIVTAGEMDECGGAAYLSQLVDGVPRSTNVSHYADIVREKAQLRDTIHAGHRLIERAYDADAPARDIVNEAERALCQIATQTNVGGFRKIGDILPGVLDQVDKWASTPGGVTGLRTGIQGIDAMTRGLQPGNMVIVAARPSMGKSALVQNIETNVARAGQTVGSYSLEMSADEKAIRAVTGEGQIDGHQLQRGRLSERDYGRFAHAIGTLSEIPLFIDEDPGITVFDIGSRARRLKVEHGLSLLTVDYVQLVNAAGKQENRTIELGFISRMLKRLAKELHVPIVVLAQLSRDVEKRIDKRPQLSDLRESGALEQDADVIVFIYRPSYYDQEPKGDYTRFAPADYSQYAELIIAKQRNGPIGTVPVRFIKEHSLFIDWHDDAATRQQSLPTGER